MIVLIFSILMLYLLPAWSLSPVGCLKRLDAGEYYSALVYGERLLKAGYKDYSTYLCVGEANMKLGRYDLAVNYLEKSLSRARNDMERFLPSLYLARSYERINEYRKALTHYKKAFDIANKIDTNASILIMKSVGQLYEKTNDYSEALKVYKDISKTATSEEDKIWAEEKIADLYIKRGNYDEALKSLDDAMLTASSIGNVFIMSRLRAKVGDIKMATGKPEEAIENYQLAIRFASSAGNTVVQAGLYERLAEAYLLSRNLNEAKTAYESALELYENLRNQEGYTRVQSKLELINRISRLVRTSQ